MHSSVPDSVELKISFNLIIEMRISRYRTSLSIYYATEGLLKPLMFPMVFKEAKQCIIAAEIELIQFQIPSKHCINLGLNSVQSTT